MKNVFLAVNQGQKSLEAADGGLTPADSPLVPLRDACHTPVPLDTKASEFPRRERCWECGPVLIINIIDIEDETVQRHAHLTRNI